MSLACDKSPSYKTDCPNGSLQGFWNSSRFSLDLSNTSGNFFGASLSLPPATDHCKEARQMTGPKAAFSLEAQTVKGTRPADCRGCFSSDFPPLIENCGVCNTGGGGRSHHVDVVMVIFTTHRATDRDKLQAIRDTWAFVTRNNTAHVKHVFVLGRAKVSSFSPDRPSLCIFSAEKCTHTLTVYLKVLLPVYFQHCAF